jgi:hypothetical protein
MAPHLSSANDMLFATFRYERLLRSTTRIRVTPSARTPRHTRARRPAGHGGAPVH